MSEKHTQGRLAIYHQTKPSSQRIEIHDVASNAVAKVFVDTSCSDRHDQSHANARRLVACWNACEGISTERLEDLGRPLLKHLIGCDERAARQVKERDELQATLQTAVHRIEDMLKDDDGQAFKEARKFIDQLNAKSCPESQGGAA